MLGSRRSRGTGGWRFVRRELECNIKEQFSNSARSTLLVSPMFFKCALCDTTYANLQHILSGCRTALSQEPYRWHRNQVLRKLAEILGASHKQRFLSPSQLAHSICMARRKPLLLPPHEQSKTPVARPGVVHEGRSQEAAPVSSGDCDISAQTWHFDVVQGK